MEDDAQILIKTRQVQTRSRRQDLVEVIAIYGLVLLILWTPQPWQELLWAVAAAMTFAIIYNSFDGLNAMGLCSGNLSCSLWAIAGSVAVAAVAVLLAFRLHTLHVPGTAAVFLRRACLYAIWASIQQLVLQCFFLSRLLRLLGDATWAAATAAVLFAVAHLPSPILMAITLVCGLAACLFFLRYRRLLPLVAAHAILGSAIAITVPSPIDHNMSVGRAYLTYIDKPTNLSQP